MLALPVQAKWSTTEEAVTGKWGFAAGEFGYVSGEPKDGFPEEFFIGSNGAILVSDQMNKRIQVYQNGTISMVQPKKLQISWVPDVWPTENSV